jgi:hypothetical protein
MRHSSTLVFKIVNNETLCLEPVRSYVGCTLKGINAVRTMVRETHPTLWLHPLEKLATPTGGQYKSTLAFVS